MIGFKGRVLVVWTVWLGLGVVVVLLLLLLLERGWAVLEMGGSEMHAMEAEGVRIYGLEW